MVEDKVLDLVAQRLSSNGDLNSAECAAVLELPRVIVSYDAGACIVQEGAPCMQAGVLVEGIAFSEIGWQHTRRQIVGLHLPGDLLDLRGAVTSASGETIMAATDCTVAAIPADALTSLLHGKPRVAHALFVEILSEASIAREWIMNVGRRSARQRLAHLCCELAWRSREVGIGDGQSFPLPLTPEQLADATGLTSVHVNQTLRKLEADGLILYRDAAVRILDEGALRKEAEFDELYLCPGATH